MHDTHRIEASGIRRIVRVGDPEGSNCYDVLASSQHLVYIRVCWLLLLSCIAESLLIDCGPVQVDKGKFNYSVNDKQYEI